MTPIALVNVSPEPKELTFINMKVNSNSSLIKDESELIFLNPSSVWRRSTLIRL